MRPAKSKNFDAIERTTSTFSILCQTVCMGTIPTSTGWLVNTHLQAKRCTGVEATPQVQMREGFGRGLLPWIMCPERKTNMSVTWALLEFVTHAIQNPIQIVKLFELILAQGFGLGVIGLWTKCSLSKLLPLGGTITSWCGEPRHISRQDLCCWSTKSFWW